MVQQNLNTSSINEISAIYYALLQCGYEFYALGKDAALVKTLETHRTGQAFVQNSFFSNIRQNTCAVYPFWPRAALLEEATFYLADNGERFVNFDSFYQRVRSAANISPEEKGRELWDWISGFPAALLSTMNTSGFQSYRSWEKNWILEQNEKYRAELLGLESILQQCDDKYRSQLQKIHVLLNPIKCAYSSDYVISGDELFVSSGQFSPESVVHEFLHPIIHPLIIEERERILCSGRTFEGLDESYVQDGSDVGVLNAAEEQLVRKLTELAMCGKLPEQLKRFVCEEADLQ